MHWNRPMNLWNCMRQFLLFDLTTNIILSVCGRLFIYLYSNNQKSFFSLNHNSDNIWQSWWLNSFRRFRISSVNLWNFGAFGDSIILLYQINIMIMRVRHLSVLMLNRGTQTQWRSNRKAISNQIILRKICFFFFSSYYSYNYVFRN